MGNMAILETLELVGQVIHFFQVVEEEDTMEVEVGCTLQVAEVPVIVDLVALV